ncbi:MAG: D-xylose ABC transporter substrate-binding protein, partial [Pseudomonadota bacterium]
TVSVFKDARQLGSSAAEIAVALAGGTEMSAIEGAEMFSGGPNGVEMTSIFLTPTPITRDNLDVVIDAGWVDQATVCNGVSGDDAPAVCQ